MSRNISGKEAYKPKVPFQSVEGLGTAPWMMLSRNGICVLDMFYAKFNGYNRSNLTLTYREMKNKMSFRLFSSAIWEVIGFGFIDSLKSGGLERKSTIYGLSNRWRKLLPEGYTERKCYDDPIVLQKLEKIKSLLKEIEDLKRKPGGIEKRMKIRELKKQILSFTLRKSKVYKVNM